jgi:hypothetical protein
MTPATASPKMFLTGLISEYPNLMENLDPDTTIKTVWGAMGAEELQKAFTQTQKVDPFIRPSTDAK